MKTAISEYGKVIVTAVIITGLITGGIAIKNNGSESTKDIPENFINESGLDTIDNNKLDSWMVCNNKTYALETIEGGKTWNDAESFINELNKQNYQGHNDWRLPSRQDVEDWYYNGGNEMYEKTHEYGLGARITRFWTSDIKPDNGYAYIWMGTNKDDSMKYGSSYKTGRASYTAYIAIRDNA